ncbi:MULTISPECIES: hypothetical protein [unclassified Leifsonia]|uniref:hypothetical protein n=1 Tax=unclassified Leifsonia TaxID=2663824 RepID=UPI0008A7A07E|nr:MULTISPECIES: hypothetical protein [unclassified Leifsonia]SEI16467.1 hypothetical protein SAMN04515694_12512 [Leifsonia sp. CL154]SFM07157.1 hypothetical protein SAMN04515692_12512 [Leifsonia sp. CL147]
MAAKPTGPASPRLSTRALLIIAAFAALGALLLILIAPVTGLLAVLFPPAYAVAAGIHSVLPLLARRLVGFPWTTTIAFALVGILAIGFTPLGVLIVIPLVITGAGFDVTLLLLARRSEPRLRHFAVGALVSALLLFLVSLPVFSPRDLTPWIVLLALAGRIVGQLAAAGAAWAIGQRVLAAGILPAAAAAAPPAAAPPAAAPPAAAATTTRSQGRLGRRIRQSRSVSR